MNIETARLRITEFNLTMAEAVYLNSQDDNVARFVPDEAFSSLEQATKIVEYLISCYDNQAGPFVYPVFLKESAVNIGYVQLIKLQDATWEIGYHIAETYCGHGYATEALQAFIPEICQRLGIKEINGIVHPDNYASKRVLEKCNFSYQETSPLKYQGRRQKVDKYLYKRVID